MLVKGLKPYHGGVIPSDTLYRSTCLKIRGNGTNGQTTFTDEKGHAITQTGSGISVSTAQTKFGGGSMSFTAQPGNYLSTPSSTNFAFGATNFTMDFWFYANTTVVNTQALFSNYGPSAAAANSWSVHYGTTTANTLSFFSYNLNSTTHVLRSTTLQTGVWHYVSIERYNGALYLYVDGNLEASTGSSATAIDAGTTTPTTIYLGQGGTSSAFNGYIENLRIARGSRYTASAQSASYVVPDPDYPSDPYLSNVSVLYNFNSTNGDITPATMIGPGSIGPTPTRTVAGGTCVISTSQSAGASGASLNVAGTLSNSSGLAIPGTNAAANFANMNFTWEAFVYPTSLSIPATILNRYGGGSAARWGISVSATTKAVTFNCQSGGGSQIFAITTADDAIVLNQWNHVAVQRTGQSFQLLVNGVRAPGAPSAAQVASADANGVWSLTSNIDIGMRPGGAGGAKTQLVGYIDSVRLTKYVARYGNTEVPTDTLETIQYT